MKKDNMCRVNIYRNCIDEGRIVGLSYILAIGNKEPHSREEALRCLEQQMDVHVDSSYGTTIENEKTMERCLNLEFRQGE